MDVACVAFYFLFILWLAYWLRHTDQHMSIAASTHISRRVISNLAAATLNTEAEFKEKLGVWDSILKLTRPSPYLRVNSLEQLSTPVII